ncbi:Uncharacterized protein FWK35_00015774 [Aphis craccivora]|uniref:Uncharacterized protein n=1 Tax=Aphis craccivora TaxID=307492 RepID=A0A6G0Z6P6_APHCR|nr:Uncharacterized protein FWK35_00015774 [Aphis craccivora]
MHFSVQNKLDNVIGEVYIAINQRSTNVLQKNVGFSILQNISNILTEEITSMEGLPKDLIGYDFVYFKYLCLNNINRCRKEFFPLQKYSIRQLSSVRC